MNYKTVNARLARAFSEFKIEKMENKYCHRTRNNASMKGWKKLYNKAERDYGKAVVKLSLEEKI